MSTVDPAAAAQFVRDRLPQGGLFAGHHWRVSPQPFPLDQTLGRELETLGRVLLQFYRAVNLLYRQSISGQQPSWVAAWLDQGKPANLIALQRDPAFKNAVPRVIRPDLLLTESGLALVELDSVPGGIGLTAWLNQTYAELAAASGDRRSEAGGRKPEVGGRRSEADFPCAILGGLDGMKRGFAGIFGDAPQVHIVVSEEAATYRPEMEWLAAQLGNQRFQVRDAQFTGFADGDAVYRFFELFDGPHVPQAEAIFQMARSGQLRLTPPPKPLFEEKMLFALLWNRNLRDFWRRELGEGFLQRLQRIVPYSWLVDPAPLPPQAAIPELPITDWRQLKNLSQRERALVLKISGFSELAWGSRGVFIGNDLSQAEWSAAVDQALASFSQSPYVLQRYQKPRRIDFSWFDFSRNLLTPMRGRVRLCPYYFLAGEGDAARANLGGVLATICPDEKKIIHGMSEAILAPCGASSHELV
jgi:hypothetical protein